MGIVDSCIEQTCLKYFSSFLKYSSVGSMHVSYINPFFVPISISRVEGSVNVACLFQAMDVMTTPYTKPQCLKTSLFMFQITTNLELWQWFCSSPFLIKIIILTVVSSDNKMSSCRIKEYLAYFAVTLFTCNFDFYNKLIYIPLFFATYICFMTYLLLQVDCPNQLLTNEKTQERQ